jgi:hypothetical protein
MITAIAPLLVVAPCHADSIPWDLARSTRSTLDRRLDELDLPRYLQRQSGFVKELRNPHFIIDAPTESQAEWALREAERAWEDLSIIADGFLTYHRDPTFAIGAVTIRIDAEPYRRPTPDLRGPRWANDGLEVYWNIHGKRGSLDEGLPDLRREVARSFFRAARMDQRVPTWALDGIAEYIADDGRPVSERETGSRGSAVVKADVPFRPVPDRLTEPYSDQSKAGLWMHYFLDADQGSRAVWLASAMSECLRQNPIPEELPPVRTRELNRKVERLFVPEGDPLTKLVSRADVRQDMGEWLAQPDRNDPEVFVGADSDGIDAAAASRLLVVLGLAQRFGANEPVLRKPQIRVITPESSQVVSPPAAPADTGKSVDLVQLHRRLIDNPPPAWSMKDADGRIVYSWERERLAGLLQGLKDLTTARTDGKGAWMIEERGHDHGVLTLTYHPVDKEHPRPEATIRWVR